MTTYRSLPFVPVGPVPMLPPISSRYGVVSFAVIAAPAARRSSTVSLVTIPPAASDFPSIPSVSTAATVIRSSLGSLPALTTCS